MSKNKLDVLNQVSQFKVPFEKPKDWVTPNGDIIQHRPFKKYLRSDLGSIFASQGINDPFLKERELVAMVFPFKINQFTIDQINWSSYLDDPIFKLTFPQPSMLSAKEINDLSDLIESGADRDTIAKKISDIRSDKNPAPANQAANRPVFEENDDADISSIDGLQHKYPKIVLMFHKTLKPVMLIAHIVFVLINL